jgi:hypothetical protein
MLPLPFLCLGGFQLFCQNLKVESFYFFYIDDGVTPSITDQNHSSFQLKVRNHPQLEQSIGILITTGLTDITKIKYNGYQLTQDDVLEAAGVGGTDGDIIMWLKCDEIVETPKLFALWSSGYGETEFMVEIVAPAGE